MNTNTCVCSDNYRLSYVRTKISYDWDDKYIGSKVIRKKYDQLFNQNGYYLDNEDYDFAAISVNMKIEFDDEGYIKYVSSSKIKDLYFGHGRPVIRDLKISKSDLKELSLVLDSVTEDHGTQRYETLCASFQHKEELPGGYRFKNVIKSGINLTDKNGTTVSLRKSNIMKALNISRLFIDVLFCEDTLLEASDIFNTSDIPLYLAVLSKVDYRDYHNLDKLLEEANHRELLRRSESGYPALCEAVQADDIEKARKYIEFAKIVVVEANPQFEPPLIQAVRNENIQMVQLLLDHGTYAAQSYKNNENQSVSPLLIALKLKNYELIKLILEHHGAEPHHANISCLGYNGNHSFSIFGIFSYLTCQDDFESIKLVLPYITETEFDPSKLSNLDIEKISYLARIPNARIAWSKELVEQAYKSDKDLCRAMLQQGCTIDVIDYFIEIEDFEMFLLYFDKHQHVSPRATFNLTFQRDKKWYQKLVKHSDFRIDQYLSQLIKDEEFNRFISITNKLCIGIPLGALYAFCNYPPNRPFSVKLNGFLKYLLDHIDYHELFKDGSAVNDSNFRWLSEVVFTHGTEELCGELLAKYPVRLSIDAKYFVEICEKVIERRNYSLFSAVLRTRILNADDEYEKNWGLWKLLSMIISRYKFQENSSDIPIIMERDSAKIISALKHWFEVLQHFASIVPIQSLTDAMLSQRMRRHPETKTILEYAIALGIKNEEFLALLH